MVKVIDFGVAKATQHGLEAQTLFTEFGQVIGTPGYMSPEQAGAAAGDIDTRTDVYSLGVLLYELLAGVRPFEDDALCRQGLAEGQRVIREVDPPMPSQRLSTLGDSSTAVAESRGTQLRTLVRQLRGDLDCIIMKCLEKDRSRRYQTVSELLMDIGRYLRREPVSAGPPSAIYRLSKFVRRNKLPVAATIALFCTLAVGGTASTLLFFRAEAQRREAVEAGARLIDEREKSDSARQEAEDARDESEQVTQFLSDMLAAVNLTRQGRNVTIRDALDECAEKIAVKLSDKPLIQARLRTTIGWAYHALGLLELAQQNLLDAAAIYTDVLGPENQRTLKTADLLTVVTGEKGHYGEAEAALRSRLEIQRRVLGEEHPDPLWLMGALGTTLQQQGRYAEAAELHTKQLDIRLRVFGEGHPQTFVPMNNLATCLTGQRRYVEAEAFCRKALQMQSPGDSTARPGRGTPGYAEVCEQFGDLPSGPRPVRGSNVA